MEVLLWLVPSAVVTAVAMLWVAWVGRDGRGAVDRDEAVRRLGAALEGRSRPLPGYAAGDRSREPSTGVAVRPSSLRPPDHPAA